MLRRCEKATAHPDVEEQFFIHKEAYVSDHEQTYEEMSSVKVDMIEINVRSTQLVEVIDIMSGAIFTQDIQRDKDWYHQQRKNEKNLEEIMNISDKEEGVKIRLL